MNYFAPDKLPVLTTLAQEFALFNRWFASIPGPTLCNRAFAHYGTSFGNVGMSLHYPNTNIRSIYQRLADAGKTSKLYYFDAVSSTMEVVNLLTNQGHLFGSVDEFETACAGDALPDYCFIEPNYTDHDGSTGGIIASDQHPDHHVLEGERFIARVYNAVRKSPGWESTALLVTYDEHGGIFDHVPPPSCPADGFVAQPDATQTGAPFVFDRLGVRVPALFISPWVLKGRIVDGRVFEHACIPATATKWLLPAFDNANRTPREAAADTFLDLLELPSARTDCPEFAL
jgi:phospholipase C